jgi:hypothetical protein
MRAASSGHNDAHDSCQNIGKGLQSIESGEREVRKLPTSLQFRSYIGKGCQEKV